MDHLNSLTSVVIVGCGAIARALIPILIDKLPGDVRIVAIDSNAMDADFHRVYGNRIDFHQQTLTPGNLDVFLTPLLGKHCFLLNLSTGISSVDLITQCQKNQTLYLDTCIEPWEGGYISSGGFGAPSSVGGHVTNSFLRQQALALRATFPRGATAVLAHGANPGLISHFVKDAILLLTGETGGVRMTRDDWVKRAQSLGINTIQIAEKDTQCTQKVFSRNTFVNTWSSDGFLSELMQPSEFGLGTHEDGLNDSVKKDSEGPGAYFNAPGASVRVKTWTPVGPGEAYLVTHNESLSISEYFSAFDGIHLLYRPTVYYAYQPCEIAEQSIQHWRSAKMVYPETRYVLRPEDIKSGVDYLGILFILESGKKFWYGSTLEIGEARRLSDFCSATTLQVAAGIYSGMRWALANPEKGIVEAENMDHLEVMHFASPFLGEMCGVHTEWSPTVDISGRTCAQSPGTDARLSSYLIEPTQHRIADIPS